MTKLMEENIIGLYVEVGNTTVRPVKPYSVHQSIWNVKNRVEKNKDKINRCVSHRATVSAY